MGTISMEGPCNDESTEEMDNCLLLLLLLLLLVVFGDKSSGEKDGGCNGISDGKSSSAAVALL